MRKNKKLWIIVIGAVIAFIVVAATILTHIYDVSGRYEMGYACAISTVLFVLMIFANVGVRKVLQKYL